MSADLEAAVARLKRDLDAIAAETSGAKEARGDVRLLLADWERLRTEESGWKEGYDNLRREKWQEEDLRLRGDIRHSEQMNDALEQLRQEEHQRTTAEQERDAARAEVERLKAEAATADRMYIENHERFQALAATGRKLGQERDRLHSIFEAVMADLKDPQHDKTSVFWRMNTMLAQYAKDFP